MEEDTKKIIIPLSEYNGMKKEIEYLKEQINSLLKKSAITREEYLKEYETKWENKYYKDIGENRNVNVSRILHSYGTLSEFINELQDDIQRKEEMSKEFKDWNSALIDTYKMLIFIRKHTLFWWEIDQKLRIERLLCSIERKTNLKRSEFEVAYKILYMNRLA